MVCTSRATSFPSGPLTAVETTEVPGLISESEVFFATATCASFESSIFFSEPSFVFTVSSSPWRLTMVPRTFVGGVWANAVLPARAMARNAMRFIEMPPEDGEDALLDRDASGKEGAPVHVQGLSGDVAGPGADEEPDRGGYLFGQSLPWDERSGEQEVLGRRALASRRDQARSDAVHGDAGCRQIVREALRQSDQTGLRRDHVGSALPSGVRGHPADVDDGAYVAALEMRIRRLRSEERAVHDDRRHGPELRVGERIEWLLGPDGGVVHQDVEAAEAFDSRLDEPGDRGLVGDVRHHRQRVATLRADLGHHRGDAGPIGPPVDRDLRTSVREGEGDGFSDVLPGAGDDRDAPRQLLRHRFILARLPGSRRHRTARAAPRARRLPAFRRSRPPARSTGTSPRCPPR